MNDPKLVAFVSRAKLLPDTLVPLTGDASTRCYFRTRAPDAVIMDVRKAPLADTQAFLQINTLLNNIGLRAPRILQHDLDGGFLALEDLGDALFAQHLAEAPEDEHALYTAAIDVLVQMQRIATPGDFPQYDTSQMAALGNLAFEWYAPVPNAETLPVLHHTFEKLDYDPKVFCHRDFHAENLIWLPMAKGAAQVGILDFQDAALCHPAYDLISLLYDARRNVTQATKGISLERYLSQTGYARDSFEAAIAITTAQRSLRILGVFARLCLRDRKPHYLSFVPRVWSDLRNALKHPELRALKALCDTHLPAPSPSVLNELKARCGTLSLA